MPAVLILDIWNIVCFLVSFSFLFNKKPHHLSGWFSIQPEYNHLLLDDLIFLLLYFLFDFTIQGEGERILNSLY